MRVAVAFLLLAGSTSALAFLSGGIWVAVPAWCAISFGLVGIAYLGHGRAVFRKSSETGKLPLAIKVALAPYLTLTTVTWRLAIVKEAPLAELAPGLYIGRRLYRSEYPAGLKALVDLTFELDEHLPDYAGVTYHHCPILDGAPLPEEALHTLAARIAGLPRPLYLHCALGHGRTAMVAAAVLLVERRATSAGEALAGVVAARPGARPNAAQCRAVEGMK